jgi:DNA-binding MurR/RpiR family transcriptional regulator
MPGRKNGRGRLYETLLKAERGFWERAVATCPKPLTVRRLAKHVGASPSTVSRRLRFLGYRFELRLTRPTR